MEFEVSPYFLITTDAEEARLFYEEIFNATTVYLQRVKDRPEQAKIGVSEDDYNRIDQSVLQFGNIKIMLADDTEGLPITEGTNVSICLTFNTAEETKAIYDRMIEKGSSILREYTGDFYTEGYGYVKDPFGVCFHLFTKRRA
ncbi:VOC family protein [Paenibacillus sp. GXUN7292]|uniref:VOC family protein n=1 Tax=Paenibacillus sp. GXUN7292 TaxID=3422499 RepID=UPI003D7EA8FF